MEKTNRVFKIIFLPVIVAVWIFGWCLSSIGSMMDEHRTNANRPPTIKHKWTAHPMVIAVPKIKTQASLSMVPQKNN